MSWLPRLGRLLPGAIIAFGLLLVGELSPLAFPVHITLAYRDAQTTATVDSTQRSFDAPADRRWLRVEFHKPDATERLYQIDGSDLAGRQDRNPDQIRAIQDTPFYRLAAWLRDEDGFSDWQQVRLVDASTNQVVAEGVDEVERIQALPDAFRLEAALRRPEARATIRLISSEPVAQHVLEVDPDNRRIRWYVGPTGEQERAAWYFPREWPPFSALAMQLIGRSIAAGYLVLVGAVIIGLCWQRARIRLPRRVEHFGPPAFVVVSGTLWLAFVVWITVRLYAQLPHVLDASTYYLQMNIFRSGQLWFEAPPFADHFRGWLQVLWPIVPDGVDPELVDRQWFGQYPPGAGVMYALGSLVGLQWLVGPIASLTLLVATAAAGRWLWGSSVALAAFGLGVISPFIHFQAGAFMSHVVTGAWLALGLAAFAYAERRRSQWWWHLVVGAMFGCGFLTREIASITFALPIGLWLLAHARWRSLLAVGAGGLPFAGAYLAYNAALTGSPFTLPRNMFDYTDRFGFGAVGPDGIHTLAAGLSYLNENLTILQFDLFGWPPLLALSLMALPFLLGRAGRLDLLLAGGVVSGMGAYVAYYGWGDSIALGPRYLYESLPWILLLSARGLQAVQATLRSGGLTRAASRAAVVGVVGVLSLNTFLYYLPHEVQRRANYMAINRDRGMQLPFVQVSLSGPQLIAFDGPSLVLVPDVAVYKTLFALNCPLLDRGNAAACPVLFLQADKGDVPPLLKAYPNRAVFIARAREGAVHLDPYQPPNGS